MRTCAMALVLVVLASGLRADDTDPEPQGGAARLKQLQGTWKVTRYLYDKFNGKTPPPFVYTFKDDKVTVSMNNTPTPQSTIKMDKTRRDGFEMVRENSKVTTKYFFKVEKGELYLAPNRSNDPKAKPDFSGNTVPVMVFEREKK